MSDNTKIDRFVRVYFESKDGHITKQSSDVFTVSLPNEIEQEYTYQSALAREKNVPLLAPGSPAFQQILRDCQENGVLCQILIKPKDGNYEALLRNFFKDSIFSCQNCTKITVEEKTVHLCPKPQPCYHQINNAKIIGIEVIKTEPIRFFNFYFSLTFKSRLRPKNEEIINILLDEKGNEPCVNNFSISSPLQNEALEIQDHKSKLKPEIFQNVKSVAYKKIESVLKEKVALFDLPLSKEKRDKLESFKKRLRKERREQVISKKHDFDFQKWQANFESLLKREEESYVTIMAAKFINLLVINTAKVRFEITLDNHATIYTSFILGIQDHMEVACPICKKTFSEGYATKDSLYVCGNCTRQSVDTKRIYSKKVHLSLDEKLNEYFEPEAGFICSVCGKKYSRLLKFECSHDNSSICINHYDLCDDCCKIFSKANLSHTDEFKHQLCPKHASKNNGVKR